MKTLSYKLKGTEAAAAKMLHEVQYIFHSKSWKTIRKNDWRLEYYIMCVMCSAMNASHEVDRNKIKKTVALTCGYDNNPDSEWNTAFRRLTKRGFLYSKAGTAKNGYNATEKTRYYGLKLSRYDTDEVEA